MPARIVQHNKCRRAAAAVCSACFDQWNIAAFVLHAVAKPVRTRSRADDGFRLWEQNGCSGKWLRLCLQPLHILQQKYLMRRNESLYYDITGLSAVLCVQNSARELPFDVCSIFPLDQITKQRPAKHQDLSALEPVVLHCLCEFRRYRLRMRKQQHRAQQRKVLLHKLTRRTFINIKSVFLQEPADRNGMIPIEAGAVSGQQDKGFIKIRK